MEIQKLREKLHEKKNAIGLVGGSIKITEYDESEHNIEAGISPQSWDIQVKLQKGFNPITDKKQQAYARKKKIAEPLETLLSDVVTHELAHWELPYGTERGCPYDIYNHDKILEAVKNELPTEKQGQAQYVANMFEDLMINPRCAEFNNGFSGQVLFWDNECLFAKGKANKNASAVYEAFMKLNMHLFGEKLDKELLKRHYTNNKKVEDAVKKIVTELELPQDIIKTKSGTAMLFDKQKWSEMAGTLARNIAELLEESQESPNERLSAYSNPNQGQGQEQQVQKPQSGNGIEQKIGTKEGKEEVAYGRYSNDESPSTNITNYEQLDALYRKLARAVTVKVEAMTKHSGLVINHLNHRPFDEEKDDPNKLKMSKVFATENGISFAYPNQPLTIQAKSKIQRRSFPDFKMVVLDNSGSMQEGVDGNKGNTNFIPWGDNSKYHYALLGFYGIENFLQRQGISQYITHGLSLFSSNTRYKEGTFKDIDEVRKLALSPEFGSTSIDARTLEKALSGRESFVLSISDGEIGNWNSEKEKFRELAKNNYFGHIQIGSGNQFTKDLESWSIPVFYVNSGQDLAKLMVDVTKQTYDKFTKQ